MPDLTTNIDDIAGQMATNNSMGTLSSRFQIKKGKKKTFEEFIKLNPSKYGKFTDQLRQKMILQAEIFGKPNVLVNFQGIEMGHYLNSTLNKFPVHELI